MIQFLAPAALFGLLLLAIPVIVHLFQPRRVRQTPFSSLRWLHLTQQRLARRIKWHQILLFMLRAGFLVLIVFALGRPLWVGTGSGEPVERIIVLDVSRSMGYRMTGGQSPMRRAIEFAAQLIQRDGPRTRTAVLLADNETTVLAPLDEDASACLPELERIRAGKSMTDLSSAMPIIEAMLTQRRSGAQVAIYFVTDQQQRAWQTSRIQSFAQRVEQPVKVHVVDVGVPSPVNAWIADAQLVTIGGRGRSAVRVTLDGCGETLTRTLSLDGVGTNGPNTQQVTIEPGRPQVVQFALADTLDALNQDGAAVARLALSPEDRLPGDDRRDMVLAFDGAVRVLLVTENVDRSAPHAVAALRVLAASRRRLSVVVRSSENLFPTDIRQADVVLLADVPELSAATVEALTQRVSEGAGAAIFVGPSVDIAAYNASMFQASNPAQGLLPAKLARIARPTQGPYAPVANVDWASTLFAGLSDPMVGDAALANASHFMQFEGGPSATDRVLASTDDQSPLIVQRQLGLGRVLFFNVTANDAWWDMPRRTSFVPFMERMIDDLSSSVVPLQFESGRRVSLVLSDIATGDKVVVRSASGQELTPTLRQVGERTHLQLQRVDETGVYEVIRERDSEILARFDVLPSISDSLLTRGDDQALTESFAPCSVELVTSESQRLALLSERSSANMAPLLLVLACLLLLGEMYLVHRLCPRVQPVIATPLVRRQRSGHAPVSHHSEAV